jgi:hypothetical protein
MKTKGMAVPDRTRVPLRTENKAFVFLYPQAEIIDFEIEKGYRIVDPEKDRDFHERFANAKSEEERLAIQNEAIKLARQEHKEWYRRMLNGCIDARYRKKGFSILFALLNNTQISNLIERYPDDKIIYVGMDEKTHKTPGPDGKFRYPNSNVILNQLGDISTLWVAGFHMWHCVDRVARRAYKRGMNVLVDEDLTDQRLTSLRSDVDALANFAIDGYPNYNPRRFGEYYFERFMRPRRNKPWYWQDY